MTRTKPKYWWKEMGYGFLLAVGIILLIKLLPNALEPQLWAMTMTIILSIYIGFALKDGNRNLLLLQIGVAAFFNADPTRSLAIDMVFGRGLHFTWSLGPVT